MVHWFCSTTINQKFHYLVIYKNQVSLKFFLVQGKTTENCVKTIIIYTLHPISCLRSLVTNATNFHYPLSIQLFKYWFFMRTSPRDFISTCLFIHNWTSRFEKSKNKMFCIKRSYLIALRTCSLFNFRHSISFCTSQPSSFGLWSTSSLGSLLTVYDNRIAVMPFLTNPLSFNSCIDFSNSSEWNEININNILWRTDVLK